MRALLSTLVVSIFFVGCTRPIELVGSGREPDIQHGMIVKLIGNGVTGVYDIKSAEIHVTNSSNEILSINQDLSAMKVMLKRDGQNVPPMATIKLKTSSSPFPDDFVILAPGQTRVISVPLSSRGDECKTFENVYRLEKNVIYEIEVVLNPYFGTFTEGTAAKILTKLKIPNYLPYPLKMNTLIVRIRPIFK
jgi:hypothetical protein